MDFHPPGTFIFECSGCAFPVPAGPEQRVTVDRATASK
jgi:hypothetical protein